MIPAKMLDIYINRNETVIVDVRNQEEYNRGHIRGAINISYEEESKLCQLSKSKTYIVYCDRGAVSLIAARLMIKCGLNVKAITGGIVAYRGVNYIDMQ